MKKFLLKFSIYILITSIITFGINARYIQQKGNDIGAFVNAVPDNIHICNFGNSHGEVAFNYDDFQKKYKCFNFALSGQPLTYDYRILQNYQNKIQKNAFAFIVVSYFSLSRLPEPDSDNVLSLNKRYYKFLQSDFIECYDIRTDFFVNYLPSLAADNLLSLIQVLISSKNDDTYNKIEDNNKQKSLEDARYKYQVHIKFHTDKNGQAIPDEDAYNALCNLINLLKELEATPILITTPYTHDFSDIVKKEAPDFLRKFYSDINEITDKTGVKYYDYSCDERYANDYSLFIDSDHLNRKGARKFTNDLMREVLGINPPQ